MGLLDLLRGKRADASTRGAAPPVQEAHCGDCRGGGAEYDLVIIGTGAAGMAAAIKADDLGARVAIVERGTLGGTCVNVGCVPSKTLIRAAEARHRASHVPFSGIRASADGVDFRALVAQKDELVASLRQAKYADVLADLPNVELVRGRARVHPGPAVEVEGRMLRARAVLVATGASPVPPPIPGLGDVPYLDHASAMALTEQPRSMIVLGGRYVALELAQMFSRLGTQVTVVQRSGHVLPTQDDDVTGTLADYLRAEGMTILTGAKTERVSAAEDGVSVAIRTDDRARELRAEKLLVATGRLPNSRGFGLEELGIRFGPEGEIETDARMHTTVPGIYAAGDVAGDPAFVYAAAYEGALAAENAVGGGGRTKDFSTLPWVIFTDPQVASVGLNERTAKSRGVRFEVAKLALSHVPRAIAARDTRGFVKLLADPGTRRLLGAQVLAPEAGEIIMEPALAIRFGLTVDQIATTLHPYLTLAEGIKLTAQSFGRDVSRLSCCAA